MANRDSTLVRVVFATTGQPNEIRVELSLNETWWKTWCSQTSISPAWGANWQRLRSGWAPRNELTAVQIETQRHVLSDRQSDACRCHDRASVAQKFCEQRILCDDQIRFHRTQIPAVEFALDLQRETKLRRAGREFARFCDGAILPHPFFTERRFDGANQNGFGHAATRADGVETKIIPVNKINVSASRRAIHGTIARRLAAKSMTSRIVREISFRLHNRAAGPRALRCAPQQKISKQCRRDDFG